MLDTTILVPALGGKVRKADDAASGPLFDAMLAARKTVLIAAPSAAELIRKAPASSIPRTRYVVVVAFDRLAAELLGTKFPPSTLVRFRDDLKATLDYIKYDAMIVACALRHNASVFVSTDRRQLAMAETVGLSAKKPRDFIDRQTVLALPPPAPRPPESKP